jgi:hypothetical protein
MTSVRDGGVGSAGSLGPGMYNPGRYHEYIKRHVASPSLNAPKPGDARGERLNGGEEYNGEDDLGSGEKGSACHTPMMK